MVTTQWLRTDPVWWRSMHAISSYRGNRPTLPARHKQIHRQDRLQYTTPLASAQSNQNGNLSGHTVINLYHEQWTHTQTHTHKPKNGNLQPTAIYNSTSRLATKKFSTWKLQSPMVKDFRHSLSLTIVEFNLYNSDSIYTVCKLQLIAENFYIWKCARYDVSAPKRSHFEHLHVRAFIMTECKKLKASSFL